VTAWPAQRRGGFVAAVAARAEAWLLEPAAPRAGGVWREAPPRPVVAVVGLGRRCGATTVARALGIELARRDPDGAAAVSCASLAVGATGLATAPARRLARSLGAHDCEATRAVGRIALVAADDNALRDVAIGRRAPLVLDVPHGTAPEPALALADRAVLVASADVEPALAEVAAAALAREGPWPLVVFNRAVESDAAGGWHDAPDVLVGESRLGARLVLAGRDPVGSLAAAASSLADACAEAAVRA
jgi:hypothetical protein